MLRWTDNTELYFQFHSKKKIMGVTPGPPFGCCGGLVGGGGLFHTSKPIVETLLEIFIPYPLNSR